MQTFGSNPSRFKWPLIHSGFIFFAVIIFFYSIGDSIMSYLAPNLIDDAVSNPFLTGIIFSFSSLVGLVSDYLFSNVIKERSVLTYSFTGIIIAIFFPLVFLVQTNIPAYLIAMGIWGIYFELILFSKSNYIHNYLRHDQHDLGWAFFNAFSSLAYLIGPTLAIVLTETGQRIPLYAAVISLGLALLGLTIYRFIFKPRGKQIDHRNESALNVSNGLHYWRTLNRRLYPVLVYLLLLNIVDATFWTMGAIIAGSHHSPLASAFFVIYLLPSFVVAPMGIKLSRLIGKKRTAFVGGLAAGIFFGLSMLVDLFEPFMVYLGLGSLFFGVTIPEIRGAIEDYCERLGGRANTLVGLTSSMGSLGYIIGPILSGGIAGLIGTQKSIGAIGWILAAASLIFLILTPRKIRLPQRLLNSL